MNVAACSGRKFRQKLTVLTCGALLMCVSATGCPHDDYTALPTVREMYFSDAGSQKVDLRGNQNVPAHTQFELVFSTDMKTDIAHSSLRVTIMDSSGNSCALSAAWADARTLRITPDADLLPDTEYTLAVDDAEDTRGNPLNTYVSESATFRTAGS